MLIRRRARGSNLDESRLAPAKLTTASPIVKTGNLPAESRRTDLTRFREPKSSVQEDSESEKEARARARQSSCHRKDLAVAVSSPPVKPATFCPKGAIVMLSERRVETWETPCGRQGPCARGSSHWEHEGTSCCSPGGSCVLRDATRNPPGHREKPSKDTTLHTMPHSMLRTEICR